MRTYQVISININKIDKYENIWIEICAWYRSLLFSTVGLQIILKRLQWALMVCLQLPEQKYWMDGILSSLFSFFQRREEC